jgi:hypothetical protein
VVLKYNNTNFKNNDFNNGMPGNTKFLSWEGTT